jgi:putative NADH-flavin reductase
VVRIVEGSIERDEDVREAVEEQDAVICALGPSRRGPPDVLAVAAGTIFPAMRGLGVRRYVGILGATVRCRDDPRPTLGAALVYGMIRLMARRFVRAAETHLHMAEQSGLDWTVVRPPRLTDDPPSGYRAGHAARLAARSSITRADLAAFAVSQLDTDRWLGKAPLVVGRRRSR